MSADFERGFRAGVEATAAKVAAHCCVSSCCDAQPAAGEAQALAACVRKAALTPPAASCACDCHTGNVWRYHWPDKCCAHAGVYFKPAAAEPREACLHLADCDEPMPNLETEPCKRCGRYYVDDEPRGEEDK